MRESPAAFTQTFYEQFGDRQECALAAFELYAEELAAAVERACMTRAAWPGRVCVGIDSAL